MRAFILLCGAIAAVATTATSAVADTCQLKLISSLTLTEQGGHYLVPVSVAGSARLLMLEFGDPFSGITTAVAEQLSLQTKPMPEGVKPIVEGEQIASLVNISAVQLDRLTVRDFDVLKIPSLAGADGVLGLDILAANDVELDLAHDKMNLFSRDHCPGKVVYWNSPNGIVMLPITVVKTSGNVLAEMTLDGQKLRVAMQTEGRSHMGMNVAHRIFGIDDHSPGLRTIATDDPDHSVYRYGFAKLSVEGLEIKNPDIVIRGDASDPECDHKEHSVPNTINEVSRCFGGADLFLGPSVLRRLHLFFAFGEKMLYVTAESN